MYACLCMCIYTYKLYPEDYALASPLMSQVEMAK